MDWQCLYSLGSHDWELKTRYSSNLYVFQLFWFPRKALTSDLSLRRVHLSYTYSSESALNAQIARRTRQR